MPQKGQFSNADWSKFGLKGAIATPKGLRRGRGGPLPGPSSSAGWSHVYPYEDSLDKIFAMHHREGKKAAVFVGDSRGVGIFAQLDPKMRCDSRTVQLVLFYLTSASGSICFLDNPPAYHGWFMGPCIGCQLSNYCRSLLGALPRPHGCPCACRLGLAGRSAVQ